MVLPCCVKMCRTPFALALAMKARLVSSGQLSVLTAIGKKLKVVTWSSKRATYWPEIP